jgi:zinc transporter 1
MRAVFLHILSDAIGSVIVIVTALISWLVPGYEWLKLYMDPSLSIAMVTLMVCTTLPLGILNFDRKFVLFNKFCPFL